MPEKGFDYPLERIKQLGAINMMVSVAKGMSYKKGIDSECHAFVEIAKEVVGRQENLDRFLVSENEQMRSLIRNHFTELGMDEHDINDLMKVSKKTTIDRATYHELHTFLSEQKKIEADQQVEQQKQADAKKAKE